VFGIGMTALTVILVLAAVGLFSTAVICGAFAIKGLVKIAHRHSPERFSSGGPPRFSIWQLHDLSTYTAAFRLLLSTPAVVVPDASCRRWLAAFRLSLLLGVVAIVWLTLR
jgi:hypothetical protein